LLLADGHYPSWLLIGGRHWQVTTGNLTNTKQNDEPSMLAVETSEKNLGISIASTRKMCIIA